MRRVTYCWDAIQMHGVRRLFPSRFRLFMILVFSFETNIISLSILPQMLGIKTGWRALTLISARIVTRKKCLRRIMSLVIGCWLLRPLRMRSISFQKLRYEFFFFFAFIVILVILPSEMDGWLAVYLSIYLSVYLCCAAAANRCRFPTSVCCVHSFAGV